MAIPSTAKQLGVPLDPSDIKEIVLDCSGILEAGEKIASYTLVRSTASIAAGLEITTGGGRDPALINSDTAIRLWPKINPTEATNARFDPPSGILLDVEATIVTDSVPSRTDQQTFTMLWVQK